MSALRDRHALVTGAGRGIGRAVAEALAAEGAALTLAARSQNELAAVEQACRSAGSPSVSVEVLDLTDRDELADLCAAVLPSVDVLVNNVGSAPSAPLERTSDDLWDETFERNVRCAFALCRAALPAMAERGWGRVVQVASSAALEGYAYTSAYVASKHALLGLTRALAAETRARWKGADLTVNAVCPGFVDTALVAESARRIARATGGTESAARARLASMNPGGRLLRPEEVAAVIRALVLEQPGATHGAALLVPA